MPAYAAIATENGYVLFGDEPLVVNTPKKPRVKNPSVTSSSQEFVSACGERALRFFQKIWKWDVPLKGEKVLDSHGKHGRKRTKRLHLPR